MFTIYKLHVLNHQSSHTFMIYIMYIIIYNLFILVLFLYHFADDQMITENQDRANITTIERQKLKE